MAYGDIDFDDFVYNRTNGTPQDIFRKLGSATVLYHQGFISLPKPLTKTHRGIDGIAGLRKKLKLWGIDGIDVLASKKKWWGIDGIDVIAQIRKVMI